MREKFYVTDAKIRDNKELELKVKEETILNELEAVGQILVDSDDISFTYLLEKGHEYTYLMIKEDFWSDIHQALKQESNVYLTNGSERMELTNFCEELNYLIENIKGNSNYGEKMVEKVEAFFSP